MAGLATLGKIAGIAGIALRVLMLVFRDIAVRLARKVRPRDAPQLVRLIVIATWTTGALGVGVWALSGETSCAPGATQTAGAGVAVVTCAGGPVSIQINQRHPHLGPEGTMLRPAPLIGASLIGALLLSGTAPAQTPAPATQGQCSPVVIGTRGEVQMRIECSLGLTPQQLQALVEAVQRAVREGQDTSNAIVPEFRRLSQQLGVQEVALANFFRLIGEQQVPIENLDMALRQLAGRHLELERQIAALGGDDPALRDLRQRAQAAVSRGAYDEAAQLLQQVEALNVAGALRMQAAAERQLLDAAASRGGQGDIASLRFRYDDARAHYEQAAGMVPAGHGVDIARYLSMAGNAAVLGGKYRDAEVLHRRAFAIWQRELGPDHPTVAMSLGDVAECLGLQAHYPESEELRRQALSVQERALGPDHPMVVYTLGRLAVAISAQGRSSEAEPLLRRVLQIEERLYGPTHPEVAMALNNVGETLTGLGQNSEAEALHRRALSIQEQAAPEHPNTAVTLNDLAVSISNQGRTSEAEPLLRRAIAIAERTLGPEHPLAASMLGNLASFLAEQGRYVEAEALARRALAIQERLLGPDHLEIAFWLTNLARITSRLGRDRESEALLRRALAIREGALGATHPFVANSLYNLAMLLGSQGRDDEAQALYRRALAICEQALGPDHPSTVAVRQELAAVVQRMPAQQRTVDQPPP
jgi:tetratricopeptide (TPR) repeat protein